MLSPGSALSRRRVDEAFLQAGQDRAANSRQRGIGRRGGFPRLPFAKLDAIQIAFIDEAVIISKS
jgi:hypothetical protein